MAVIYYTAILLT